MEPNVSTMGTVGFPKQLNPRHTKQGIQLGIAYVLANVLEKLDLSNIPGIA
jgi:hypothetical protein